MHDSWSHPDLDALALEVADVARRVDQARAACRCDDGRGSDIQVLLNYAALAPFANPELLPPLLRDLQGRRATRRPSVLTRTPPRGISVIRTPQRGIPHPRDPRFMD
jgi:hypothetical protein